MMKIGIIGSGKMGKTLGSLLYQHGHEVTLGTRRINELEQWAVENQYQLQISDYQSTAESSHIIFLTTAYKETQSVVSMLGNIKNKTLVDCTNPEDPDNNYEHRIGASISWAEEIAGWLPEARIVKAFNHMYGSMLIKGSDFNGIQAPVFYCGDDEEAKSQVASIAMDLGLDPIDAGELKRARQLEPLAELLVHFASMPEYDGSDMAFKLLRR
ncbi:NADPH-dependent F420 reductase [bacterium]|nr:NADPH-dependent F420 reductase [bacterium]